MRSQDLRKDLRVNHIELTVAELIEQRDLADAAGNEKAYQYLCGKLDELDHEGGSNAGI